MLYNELFTIDQNKIEKIVREANIELDVSIIVTLNKMMRNEHTTDIILQKRYVYFLPNCLCYSKSAVYIDDPETVMTNLKMFLHNLPAEQIIIIAKYHNLYYKIRIFERVLLKEIQAIQHHHYFTLINWIYDHLCIYLYSTKYII
jgi:hypothetical protein